MYILFILKYQIKRASTASILDRNDNGRKRLTMQDLN